MALSPGARLGPYEILSAIGAGGMGEVYKARDTRLDRTVAIKILPPDVRTDQDRRARFEREAKTIAGLSHPHICTLFDVGETDGTIYLVMEHLAGETLAQRLGKGPLPLEQALIVATEIADALAAAHRQGAIHRDLKPGIVMLTKSGAKLLDFGLAKLTGHGEQPAAASLASAPTRTRPLTSEGAIVGTLQYMAPEQVEGRPADARTDLWALGAILYEMMTGKRAFEGASAASLIASILERQPVPVSTLQPLTPPVMDRLVRQCLSKVPDDRPDTAHDVGNDLRWIRETGGVAALTGARPRLRQGVRTALVVAVAAVAAMLGAGAMWLLRAVPPRASLVRLSLDVRPADEVNAGGVPAFSLPTPGGSRTALTWTPDGQALVFAGRRGGVQQLYVRRLDGAEARPLANTEGAQVPAVSTDGQWVAFWARGAIRKVPLSGGPELTVASGAAQPPWGLAWDEAGQLVFGVEFGPIWAVPPDGVPVAVTTLGEGELTHSLPSLLPGGRAILYTVRKRWFSWGDEEVVAQTLATGERKVLLKDATDARYVRTGHLVFLRGGILFAAAFDPERLQLLGKAVPVLDTVAQALSSSSSSNITGAGQFAIAPTGTLAWIPSPVAPYPDGALVTVDRHGQVSPLPAPVRPYGSVLRLSPEGHRLALTLFSPTDRGLWICDLERGTLTPLTRDGEVTYPTWLPGGQRLVFSWLKDGRRSLAIQPADGTAPPRVLLPGAWRPSSTTPDGRQLVAAASEQDIAIVALNDGQARAEFPLKTPEVEQWPVFSPDGRWLVYASDVSGRFEVYERPFPGLGPAEPVSLEGGDSPAWHPNGHELFFLGPSERNGKRRMMAATFTPGSPPRIGRAHPLFEFDPNELLIAGSPVRNYDVAPDGEHFYAVQLRPSPPRPPVTQVNIMLNWFEELKAKVPVKR